MTTQTNFLGIPVDGDITRSNRKAQRPIEEFQAIVKPVIDDEGIVDFGWRQYTPYFNDGDPCEFSAREPWFRTAADVKDGDEDDFDYYEFELDTHPTLGIRRWDNAARNFVNIERDEATKARHQRCHALAEALGSGEFDDVLLQAFGDHASVRITREKITVDEYSHD